MSARVMRVARAGALLLTANALCSCALAVSFDGYALPDDGTASSPPVALFAVSGNVTGLGVAHATLSLKGTSIEVQEGPFVFPRTLVDGSSFQVDVRPPDTHACTVARGSGTIERHDHMDVVVACVSRDAALRDLALSTGALSPSFAPNTTTYRSRARFPGVLAASWGKPMTASIVATTMHPDARITVDGVSVGSGRAIPIELRLGSPQHVVVRVQAPSGEGADYDIEVTNADFDYFKSDVPGLQFGAGIALAGPDRLAVSCTSGRSSVFERVGRTWALGTTLSGQGGAISWDGNTIAIGGGNPSVLVRSGMGWDTRYIEGVPWSDAPYSVVVHGSLVAVGGAAALGANEVTVFARLYDRSNGVNWSEVGSFARSVRIDGAHVVQPEAPSLALAPDTLVIGVTGDSSAATGINVSVRRGEPTQFAAVAVCARFDHMSRRAMRVGRRVRLARPVRSHLRA